MKEKHIQTLGIAFAAFYGLFVVFLYATAPRSVNEIPAKAIETVQNAATKGQILTGTYEIDNAKFAEGLTAFRQDNFIVARDLFARSDPEKHDANVQFYIAYSFYRQGWGRVTNDDALFKQGLEAALRVSTLDPNYRSTDPDLKLASPAELENEFQEGMKITAGDFNPLKVLRERK